MDFGNRDASSVFDDYEFRRLVATELESLKAGLPGLALALKTFYVAMRGNPANIREIYIKGVGGLVRYKLEQKDLPGPDSLYKDRLIEEVIEELGEIWDAFFAPQPTWWNRVVRFVRSLNKP